MVLFSIPDELLGFISYQLERFGVDAPSDICIDTIGLFVTTYVVKHNYYQAPAEVERRFYDSPGLSEVECQALIPELEIVLKLHKWQQITDTQLQLCI